MKRASSLDCPMCRKPFSSNIKSLPVHTQLSNISEKVKKAKVKVGGEDSSVQRFPPSDSQPSAPPMELIFHQLPHVPQIPVNQPPQPLQQSPQPLPPQFNPYQGVQQPFYPPQQFSVPPSLNFAQQPPNSAGARQGGFPPLHQEQLFHPNQPAYILKPTEDGEDEVKKIKEEIRKKKSMWTKLSEMFSSSDMNMREIDPNTQCVVLPFKVERKKVGPLVEEWLSSLWWKPVGFEAAAKVNKDSCVSGYFPFLLYHVDTLTNYSADVIATNVVTVGKDK